MIKQTNMPPPDTYELEYFFWPWGRLLEEVAEYVINKAPQEGFVLDYMCGTGFLLHHIGIRRSDLILAGTLHLTIWQHC